MYISRHIADYAIRMTRQFKVLLIIGPRQVGKSTFIRKEFLPDYEYVVLDDLSELDMAQNDPALFFKNHPIPVVVDEVQRSPNLFLQIKLLVDKSDEKGRIILTGAQSYRLLKEASDSLAGRVCQKWPTKRLSGNPTIARMSEPT